MTTLPSSMIHLLTARKFRPDCTPLFYIGSLSPDCIHDRETKDATHFRDSKNRTADLTAFAEALDLSDDFQLGTLLHLFTDFEWDNGPMEMHKRAYKGSDWFHDYRSEISIATGFMYQHLLWAEPTWQAMLEVPTSEYSSISVFPADMIHSFIERNLVYQNIERKNPSEFFNPELIDSFTEEVAQRFGEFLKKL